MGNGIKLKIASLFASIGGIDIAFEQAGHEIVWANEMDKYAVRTYKKKFSNVMMTQQDIRSIVASSIPDMDVLTAGFLCHSFSMMSYRRLLKK